MPKGYKLYAHLEYSSPHSYDVKEAKKDLQAQGHKVVLKPDGDGGTYVYRSLVKYKRQARKSSPTRRLYFALNPEDSTGAFWKGMR